MALLYVATFNRVFHKNTRKLINSLDISTILSWIPMKVNCSILHIVSLLCIRKTNTKV
jgi:hypothetical protein